MKLIAGSLLLLTAAVGFASPADRLWYTTPAQNWNEALPVGNGRLGAMVYGGVASEKLSLNDNTLWSGGPREWNNPKARAVLPLVRKAIDEKRYADADQLSKQMQGPFNESYMPMGDLLIESAALPSAPSDYTRDLQLDAGVATTTFRCAEVTYRREVFVSRPGRVLVVRLTADRPGAQSLRLRLNSKLRHEVRREGSALVLAGECPRHVIPQYRWEVKDEDALQYAKPGAPRGMGFQVRLLAIADGGESRVRDGLIEIEKADAVTVLLSSGTSYVSWDQWPDPALVDPAIEPTAALAAAAVQPYAVLRATHVADHHTLFRRVTLDLGENELSSRATDERLKAGIRRDPALAALAFHYARYLLIATSRPGEQPGNLKGIWNDRVRPEYSSNWCIDHDAQMYYYPVEVVALPELHDPFLTFIENLAVNGRKTAEVNYGMRGWVTHHNADLWRQSAPVGNWGDGNPHWASFALSGPWLAQHLWEHYAFTGDRDFLRRRAWPLMKGAAEFCLDWLVEDADGHLITNPSVSPENTFVLPDGSSGQMSQASTVDMSLLWELFTECIDTAKILGIEPEFAAKLEQARARLLPPKIGKGGRLQEWSEDWESTDPGHRHLSPLYGIYPGRQWTPFSHPELAEASKTLLRIRDASDYGWSLAWKAACWARLREGDEALARLEQQVRYVDGGATQAGKGWFFPNMFNGDPPFVLLNGNMCVAAAMSEMLLQSHAGEIDLLPALPSAWAKGQVRGLRARGGYTVDLSWDAGRLRTATLRATQAGSCCVRSARPIRVRAGANVVPVRAIGEHVYEFAANPGDRFDLAVE